MKHFDCRNYAPVDVVKGICHRTKNMVMGDEEQCAEFDRMPRCRFCSSFAPAAEEHLGNCGAAPSKPMTYPDLCAVTCRQFEWKKD